MGDEAAEETEETKAKPTITIAEKTSGNTSNAEAKPTITIAEREKKDED